MTADEIRALRVRLGLTQEQMAQRMGVSFATINRWENGKMTPRGLYARALDDLAHQHPKHD
jgi:transcriptional regulator with XRE-family HTH domain